MTSLVSGVGSIGVGHHKSGSNGKHTDAYEKWQTMLLRCYNQNQIKRRPSYADCFVCDEWLNFQNFAEWLLNNPFYGRGYQIDKDLLFDGNKIYEPSKCCLIPREINSMLTDKKRKASDMPTGVYLDKRYGTYRSKINMNGEVVYLGSFKNKEDAFSVYVEARETYVKSKALEWKGRIADDVFDALMIWKVRV